MPERPELPLMVFYDGACSVCVSQVERYRGKDREGRLIFLDLSAGDFRPDRYGFSQDQFTHELHAIDRVGNVYRGPEAFWAVWRSLPSSTWYRLLSALVTLPGFRRLARIGYWCFARIRKRGTVTSVPDTTN